jgi:prepilin-type N-terminal cleavage/methylation domain-containing protein
MSELIASRQRRPRGSHAFTLIELLVVIAIIAILAAILFPVFAQAKKAAKQAVSLSNVKQQSLGLLMYTNDYDDTVFLPWEMGVYPVQVLYPYTHSIDTTWDAGNPIPNFQAPMSGSYWGDWTLIGSLSWSIQGLEYATSGPNMPRVLSSQANPSQHAVLVSLSNPNQPMQNYSFGDVVPGEQGWFTFDGWNDNCYETNGTLADWESNPYQGIVRASMLWHNNQYLTGFQDGHAKLVTDEGFINPNNDCANQTYEWWITNTNGATTFPNYSSLQPVNAWGAWMIQPKHLQYWGAWWDPSE